MGSGIGVKFAALVPCFILPTVLGLSSIARADAPPVTSSVHPFEPSYANDMAIPGRSDSPIGSGNEVQEESSPSRDPGPPVRPSMSLAPTDKNFRLRLGLSEDYYFAGQDALRGLKSAQEAQVRFRGQTSSAEELGESGFRGLVEVGGRNVFNVGNDSLVEAPEGYLRYWFPLSDDTRMTLTVGRVKEKWSELDSYWQEEIINSQVRWDYLNPEEQGQVGLFAEVSHENFRVLAFWSPVSIPEQGPAYKVSNGVFSTHNDWFSAPVSQAFVLNGVTNIHYDLEAPNFADAAVKQSFGAMLEWGTKRFGPWARLSYICKPNNQPLTPFNGGIVLNGNGGYAAVTLYPTFTYEHVGDLDIGWHEHDFNFWFSTLARTIQNPNPDQSVTFQYQDDGVLVSPGGDVNLYRGHGVSWTANGSYVYEFKGGYNERGEFASADNTLFAKPLLYTNAYRAGSIIRWGEGAGQWTNSFIWTQTFSDKESMINFRSEYAITRGWAVALNLDVLGSDASATDQSFISRFRGNDRLLVSTQYVF